MTQDDSSATKPSNGERKRLGDRLVDRGVLSSSQLTLALEEQKRTGEPVG